MTAVNYPFRKSLPILTHLAYVNRRSHHLSEDVPPIEYIDNSLSLLADLQQNQDNHLQHAFEDQHVFINDKFANVQYENGLRDSNIQHQLAEIKDQQKSFEQRIDERFKTIDERFKTIDKRFEEIDQRLDRLEKNLEDFKQEIRQEIGEMKSRTFNALSYRAYDCIHPVGKLQGGRLVKPDPDYFPGTIKKFWKLQDRKNAYRRFYLLQFYDIEEFKGWGRQVDTLDSDSDDDVVESLTLEQAARSYPIKCLRAFAARLGLDYDKIFTEMRKLEEYTQQQTYGASKRQQSAVISDPKSPIPKRLLISASSSTKSEPRELQSPPPKSSPIPKSHDSSNIVPETEFSANDSRPQMSTEEFSLHGDEHLTQKRDE